MKQFVIKAYYTLPDDVVRDQISAKVEDAGHKKSR